MRACWSLCALLLLGCNDPPPEDVPRSEPPVKVERPQPPQGGEVDATGTLLRCPSRRFAMTQPWWFVYSDKDNEDPDCPTGFSESRLHTVTVTEQTGTCTVGWTGTLRQGAAYRFAGVGAEMAWADLRPYTDITVMTRGDGQTYRMELVDGADTESERGCEDSDWDNHGVQFVCGDGQEGWKAVTMKLSDFVQEGWGTPRDLDLTGVDRVHVRTTADTTETFACDFWIQSVTLRDGNILPFQ